MATINKIYPHVNVTTKALIRTAPEFVDSEATTMFVPFYSKKGLANQVQKIYILEQFISEYGEPDFDYQGRTVLNIYNWLNAGGAIYALRLTSPDAKKAEATEVIVAGAEAEDDPISFIEVAAKYPGSYYNEVELLITKSEYSTDTEVYADVQILVDSKRVQSLYRLKYDTFITTLNKTSFVEVAIVSDDLEADFTTFVTAAGSTGTHINLENGTDGNFSFEQSLQRFLGSTAEEITVTTIIDPDTDNKFIFTGLTLTGLNWAVNDILVIDRAPETFNVTISAINESTGSLTIKTDPDDIFAETPLAYTISFASTADSYISIYKTLESKLELPIDVIMDPGYSSEAKDLLLKFSEERDDIFFYISEIDFSESEIGSFEGAPVVENINQALYTQKFAVEDVISGKNIWVAPTYFLSRLLPTNDRVYGMQWPTAGLSRGVLVGVQGINENPTSDKKTSYYKLRTNYVEKDSRGYKFMSQLTGEVENTALRFINNVRVVNKMVRDLENLGREYLFEFNDATTLNNMRAALNRYVTEWIQNRTLNFAEVTVTPNAQIDERVDVTLTIKFTGTIEIISIDITIE